MKKLLLGFLFSFLGLVVSLLLVEIGYRLLLKVKGQSLKYNDRPFYYFQASNAEDLRDFHYDQKKENSFRIAVVGDSFSFAPYMQFTDTFPKILERMLNLNQVELTGEVVNYGVPGYSTSHEVREVRKAISQGADLILLQITLNDAELKPYRPIGITHFDTWGNIKVDGWKKNVLDHWKSLAMVLTRIHNEKTRRDYIDYFHDLFFEDRSWNVFAKSLRRILSVAEKSNVPVVAVVFPLYGIPLDEDYPFHRIHNRVGEELASLGIPTLDLFSTYEGVPLERIQVIPGEDRHPNEIGHRIAAEAIYSWLETETFIPEPLVIQKRYTKRTQIVREEEFDSKTLVHKLSRLSASKGSGSGLN